MAITRVWKITERRGVTAADVIVLIVLFVVAVLIILMFLPRGREHARMAGCENNLAHIGFAVAVFDGIENRLPGVEGVAAARFPARRPARERASENDRHATPTRFSRSGRREVAA